MIQIPFNERKVQELHESNAKYKKALLSKENLDECDRAIIKFIDERSTYTNFGDVFWEYEDIISAIRKEYSSVVPDTRSIDNTKFIVSNDYNSYYDIEMYSDYKLEHIYMFDRDSCDIPYGVCDNASQILERYQPKEDEVVIMVPVFREPDQPYSGWRWHKWGPYIGVHQHHCEYLNDEENIDFVFCFSIYKIVPCND